MNAKTCPLCHTAIPEHAPGGLCPACVLRGADEPSIESTDGPPLDEVSAAFPKLEILRLIGHGGMGYVYQARQPDLDRMVALKILSPVLRRDPAFEERFAREARVLGKLKHPNIVTLYEHGESGGYFYLMMEYIDGVNLRQAMSAGRFSPEQALAIVPAICDALQTAHAEGVWHRDIKPENILLDRDGRVKIADFGIARILGDPERNFTLTRTGGQLGSAAYMAPEQHERPHSVDHRADIYSLGVVIYEMLTGELPLGRFPAPSQRAKVNSRIDEIVMRTLEKERELRQQSAGEVKTEVEGAATMTGQDHRQTSGSNSGQFHPPLQGVPVKWLILAPSISMSVGIGLMLLNKAGVPMSSQFMQAVIPVIFFAVFGVGIAVMKRRGGGLQTQTPKASGVQWNFWGIVGSAIGSSVWMPMVAITSGWSGAGVALSNLTAAGVLLAGLAIWSNRHRLTPLQGSMLLLGAIFVASGTFLLGANWLDLSARSTWPGGKMVSAASLVWILMLIPALAVWGWFMHKIGNSRSGGFPGGKSEAGHPQSPKPEHFSRTAIVGACLIAVPFLQMFVVTGLAPRQGSGFGEIESWWVLALVSQKFIAVIVPILATLLGWIAVSQIRRSAGKLHGLWLAVFDGLFYPLLVLDFFLTLFFHSLGIACGWWTQIYDDRSNAALIVWSCITWPIVDFFIIRRIWRTVNGRPHTPAPQSTTPSGSEPPVSLQRTMILHAVLFALIAVIFVIVLPRFGEILRDMGVPGNHIPRVGIFQETLGVLLLPVLFGIDVGLCYLVRKFGGLRGLRQWSVAVILVMVAAIGASSGALYLPLKSVIANIGGPTSAENSNRTAEEARWVAETFREAKGRLEALKRSFPDFSTPQGAVIAYQVGLETQNSGAVLAAIPKSVVQSAVSPSNYAKELIAAHQALKNSSKGVAILTYVNILDPVPEIGTMDRYSQKRILGRDPGVTVVVQFKLSYLGGIMTSNEICAQEGKEWRVIPDEEPTQKRTQSAKPTPFLDWAQGEWVLDREETLRAIGLLIPDVEKRKLVLEKVSAGFAPHIDSDRLKFLPDAVKSWQVGKLGVPVPADIPSFGKLTISPIPKASPGSSSESLEATLQLRMQGSPEVEAELRPSTFSKTQEGLLQWKFEYNGEKRLAVYRRSDETETAAASTDVESWSYTLRHLDAARLDAQMKAKPQAGVATKVEAGVVTLTGPREAVRPLATMLRAIDQPEVKDPLQLPLLNMPPDFFTRLAIPGLMTGTELKDSLFEPAFFETLKRENITAPQLARALSAHVLELEKSTFLNTGTPFESIIHTPGASTYYDGTIPCADQPEKPLTLRIRRTTQQIGTKPDIAGFAPWLIEEAKKKSKEPIPLSAKGAARAEAENPAVTTLAQDAAMLASTKGKTWRSGVVDLRRENGHQFQSILILEFAPFVGNRENPPDASVKVSSTSPTVKEGPIELNIGIGDADFKDVRLEEKDGNRRIKITQAIETVDHPTKKTERFLNDYRSMSFGYELTADTLTLKGFPTDEITWGSIGFIAPTRDIVFKLTP